MLPPRFSISGLVRPKSKLRGGASPDSLRLMTHTQGYGAPCTTHSKERGKDQDAWGKLLKPSVKAEKQV